MQVVHLHRVLHDVVRVVVGLAVGDAGLHATARHPHREAAGMVVAAVVVARELALAVDGAAELAGPEHQRVVEQAALLEVGDERRLRAVHRGGLLRDLAGEVPVLVPAAHVELDEPHVALGQAARQQAVGGEAAGLVDVGAVHLERGGALGAEVGEFRHRHLHAVRHLVLRDAGARLGVQALGELLLVEAGHQVEHAAPVLAGDAVGIAQVEHRVAAGAEAAALVLARQEAASPEACAQCLHVAGALRDHHHEGRQVGVHAAEAVAHPAAEAGAAGLLGAGLEEGDAGLVVDGLRVHRMHEAEVLRHAAGVRDELGQHDAVLVVGVAVEAELAGRHREAALAARHGGDALAVADGIRQVLVEARQELRLVVVEVELAGRALHVEVDDALGLGREVGAGKRRGSRAGHCLSCALRRGASAKETGKRRGTEPRADGGRRHPEEPPTRHVEEVLLERVGVRGHGALGVHCCRFTEGPGGAAKTMPPRAAQERVNPSR